MTNPMIPDPASQRHAEVDGKAATLPPRIRNPMTTNRTRLASPSRKRLVLKGPTSLPIAAKQNGDKDQRIKAEKERSIPSIAGEMELGFKFKIPAIDLDRPHHGLSTRPRRRLGSLRYFLTSECLLLPNSERRKKTQKSVWQIEVIAKS